MKIKLLVSFFILLVLTSNIKTQTLAESLIIDLLFTKFINQYNKSYSLLERTAKKIVFTTNILLYIPSILLFPVNDAVLSPFLDLTFTEFKQKYTSPSSLYNDETSTLPIRRNLKNENERILQSLPTYRNFASEGYVSPPAATSGYCSDSWAFAAADHIETVYKKKIGGTLKNLSVQQQLDCAPSFSSTSCDGMIGAKAMNYIKSQGINTDSSYPYSGSPSYCSYSTSQANVNLSSWSYVSGDEYNMVNNVNNYGSLLVTMKIPNGFHAYNGGIISDSYCNSSYYTIDTVIIGWGVENSVSYWILKSNYGSYWGEGGYFKLRRNTGECNINGNVKAANY